MKLWACRQTHSSCSAGVWAKLPPVISLNPDLTKDLGRRWRKNTCSKVDRHTRHFSLTLPVDSLTATRRRRGRCAARSGRSRTGRYLWCRCTLRDTWAAGPCALQPAQPGSQQPHTAGASLPILLPALWIPFLLSRYSPIMQKLQSFRPDRQCLDVPWFLLLLGVSCAVLWCSLRSDAGLCLCSLRLNRKGTSPADSFCKEAGLQMQGHRQDMRTDFFLFFFQRKRDYLNLSSAAAKKFRPPLISLANKLVKRGK